MQPRRGGRLALKARTGGIVFYNTHIESGRNEQLQQRQMAEIVADQALTVDGMPVVIAGDFNNRPAPHSLTLKSLTHASFVDALGDAVGRGPTSQGQRQPIDWIFGKHIAAATGRVIDAAAASDHSPVITAFGAFRSSDLAVPAAAHAAPALATRDVRAARQPHLGDRSASPDAWAANTRSSTDDDGRLRSSARTSIGRSRPQTWNVNPDV